MKNIVLLLIGILTLYPGKEVLGQATRISGTVKNSKNELVTLRYFGKTRNASNFDGFQSLGVRIDNQGKFRFRIDYLTSGAEYILSTLQTGTALTLFEGDDLQVEFDIDNFPETFFARGKGAGRINIQRLAQFNAGPFYNKNLRMKEFELFVDSITALRLEIIEAVYRKDPRREVILKADNRDKMVAIITGSPLSLKEYEFLRNDVLAFNANAFAGYLAYLADHNLADSLPVNFSDGYFDFLRGEKFGAADLLNTMSFQGYSKEQITLNLHEKLQRAGKTVTYAEWNSVYDDSTVADQAIRLYHESMSPEAFDVYLAIELSSLLNMGEYEYYKRYKPEYDKYCTSRKYSDCLLAFEKLIDNGLTDNTYRLDDPAKTLDYSAFHQLLDSFKGEPCYIVVWSARWGEAFVLPLLPHITDLEKTYRGKMKVIDVCIDEPAYKGLWAAKIIDNSWKGNHFFYPVQSVDDPNEPLVKELKCGGIFSLCQGESYCLATASGELITKFAAPRDIKENVMKDYIK